MEKPKDTQELIIIVFVLFIFYLAYNFLGKIKIAPTTFTANPAASGYPGTGYPGSYTGQPQVVVANANTAGNQAALSNAFGNLGLGIGNAISGLAGGAEDASDDTSSYDY
jgi:hypothetical protein